jgi:general secretion pathway protein D
LVIAEIDQPAKYVSTTFVYTLKNARADVISSLLNEAVGNRISNGPVGGSLTNNGLTQSSGTTNQTSGTPGLTSAGGNSSQSSFTSNALLATTTQNQQQNEETSGFDENGNVVNVRNLTGQVLFVPNIDTNSLIIVAPPEDQGTIKTILDQLDALPEQVMIETLVVEVTLDKATQFGVESTLGLHNPFGGLHGTLSGTTGFLSGTNGLTSAIANANEPTGALYTFSAGQYSLALQAIEQDTKFNVLSTPKIFTTNNATAQINISESVPYITSETVDATIGNTYNYGFLDVGVVLTVTPRITSGGNVTMDVTQTANDLLGFTSYNAPEVNQRETETTVSVLDGRTVVLGGLMQNQVNDITNKVPILGDIPVLGNFFRSNNKTKSKTELLVFLTPHIVHNAEDAERIREDADNSSNDFAKMIPKNVKTTVTTFGAGAAPATPNGSIPATPGAAPQAPQNQLPVTVPQVGGPSPAPAVNAPAATAPAANAPAVNAPAPSATAPSATAPNAPAANAPAANATVAPPVAPAPAAPAAPAH